MNRKTLVTTADNRTWPTDEDASVLFLGEWCKRFSQKRKWEDLNADVLPYHWDNREKLVSDYAFLQDVYENVLVSLANKLNNIHSVDHSLRYWRILIGPWLAMFVQILFDRWSTICDAINDPMVDRCIVFERDSLSLVPNDIQDFNQLFIQDDWNEAIYAQLLQMYFSDKINIICVPLNETVKFTKDPKKLGLLSKAKGLFKQVVGGLNYLLPKKQKFFFLSTYLPLKTEISLQIRLLQFPRIWRSIKTPVSEPCANMRTWNLDLTNGYTNTFEKIIHKFIPLNLPSCYLEGYEELSCVSQDHSWPSNPKVIFTANADIWDDVFKVYAAQKVDAGAALVIGQHGGHYGMTPFSFTEDHQIEISDKWLSWGWSDICRPKITPVGNFKAGIKLLKYNNNGAALMVEGAFPRYSYYLYAVPIASQWLKYFESQKIFINSLPSHIRDMLILKLYPNDYGWDQAERFREVMKDENISDDEETVSQLVKRSRLYISTYNATTYLESLSSNIPTVIFWDPSQWEINADAAPYFDLLKDVGIFHETPESAALHVGRVWENIPIWWESAIVQSARKKFCEKYSHSTHAVSQNIKEIMSSLVHS